MSHSESTGAPSQDIHFAYVDEAGDKGLIRNLKQADDHKFGVMAALVFTAGMHDECVRLFTPGFEEFRDAAPPGAKLHITDAFKPGYEEWGKVATRVREDFLKLILAKRPMVIYGARRFILSRLMHEDSERMKKQAQLTKRSKIKLIGGDRPSDRRIEDDLILSLTLRIDGLGELATQAYDVKQIDLLFDETDAALAKRYDVVVERTRNVSHSSKTVRGWDPENKEPVEGTIEYSVEDAPFRVDTEYLGDLRVVGKSHPLVLAADIVTNYLHYHLKKLPPDAPLHAPSSIAGWRLAERVWGVDDDATDDQI